ncbi:MAG: hypothetical protein P8L18_01630 [Verrucomicrobiota bacterium]|jgi:hypothetical protein|nr:hypothetical protein [Verrucomicrobiota bacterium]MDG1889984.1 hypothetical protein [Verrucomicrobiota bacterium]
MSPLKPYLKTKTPKPNRCNHDSGLEEFQRDVLLRTLTVRRGPEAGTS